MSDQPKNAESIFGEAIQLQSADDRAVFVEQTCGGDSQLRAEVEQLVADHFRAGSFLEEPVMQDTMPPTSEQVGSHIGPYKLRERLGEGGMGVVWAAEQKKPLRRKVALKVIKPGMDTSSVIARFETGREALSLMDHPNIARALDAGTTDQGRPYLVMELIRGVPITDYCDAHKLTVRERLELFTHVCKAVQHAHQKGIIHRDIKPSNVLVTEQDGKPVAKVIDFGVAKALHHPLTDRSVYTGVFQAIGTLAYMSPEQASLSATDIDTRADIYGLGVLLYELLTGSTPFDRKQLESAALDEACRIIREQYPLKPSTRLGTLGEKAAVVSKGRSANPTTLSKAVRGELDWIVMKTLEKNRTRRYDTASSLADDVERFLKNEPIVARSPSAAYRFKKFASRNRVALATSAIVVASLCLGVLGTIRMAQVAWKETRRAEDLNRQLSDAKIDIEVELQRKAQALQRLADAAYREAVARELGGDRVGSLAALEIAEEAGVPSYQLAVVRGLMALNDARIEEAIAFAKQALVDNPAGKKGQNVGARALLASACLWGGHLDRWEEELHEMRAMDPQSDTDQLLMAYAVVLQNPDEAMGRLEARPTMLRSRAGILIRGQGGLLKGLDQKDRKLVDQAIGDLEMANFLMHDSPCTRAWLLKALATAIEFGQFDGSSAGVAKHVEKGHSLAVSLDGVTDYPWGDYCRWCFYVAVGEEQRGWRAIRRSGAHAGDYALSLAADCLRRRSMPAAAVDFNESLELDKGETPYIRLARAHLVIDGPNRADRVRELVLELVNHPSPLIRRHALSALCLASDSSDEVRRFAGQANSQVFQGGYQPGDLFDGLACLDLLSGRRNEVAVLEKAGEHGYALANLHFTLAMMRLAEKDRDGALVHFRKCADTHTIGSIDYELGRAYLIRMEADDTWPHWLHDGEVQ